MEVQAKGKKVEAFVSGLTFDETFDLTEKQKQVRQEGLSALAQLELPTTREEYWKYTRVAKWVNKKYRSPKTQNPESLPELSLNHSAKLVFVNGIFHAELSSLSTGEFFATPLSKAKVDYPELVDEYIGKLTNAKEHVFSAINHGYYEDGYFIHIPKNTQIKKPIHVIQVSTGEGLAPQTKNLVVAEQGSEAKLVIHEWGNETTENFSNQTSEVFIGENSHFTSVVLQENGQKNAAIATTDAKVDQNGTYRNWTFNFNGALLRNNHNVAITGENCEVVLNGLSLGREKSLFDNHTFIDHIEPHCESHELYRGIYKDNATGVFNGKVMVRQYAQKTNAFQENNNILLSDKATVNAKPELEIYADDVKCSHGSTTGQLDESALFYLMTRGVKRERAHNLLVKAFAHDVVEDVPFEVVKEYIDQVIEKRFE